MPDINTLVERWRAGDESAAEALYNHHRAQVFRLAFAILGDWDDAEEVAQDALVYALSKIDRYDPRKARFSTWLHVITVSRCRNKRRRRRSLLLPLTTWLRGGGDVADPTPSQERLAIQAEMRGEIWQVIQGLSPPLREAILLRHWAGHTYREIAEILDCPLATAQSRVRLAHQRLRATLTRDNPLDIEDLEEASAR
jgi:RNA polymerase sigma-70 factor (ECF subfamily)